MLKFNVLVVLVVKLFIRQLDKWNLVIIISIYDNGKAQGTGQDKL